MYPRSRRLVLAVIAVSVSLTPALSLGNTSKHKHHQIAWRGPSGYSWYGPGFYGRPLACGGTLQPGMVGVAHKYLPCGRRIRFHYNGRTVIVPVIDRGPYVSGRDWDFTDGARAKLGLGSTGYVRWTHAPHQR